MSKKNDAPEANADDAIVRENESAEGQHKLGGGFRHRSACSVRRRHVAIAPKAFTDVATLCQNRMVIFAQRIKKCATVSDNAASTSMNLPR